MPIFERNSLGSNVKITANENYSYADMGRILSECVQNDMTLFNAVLLNDFKENTAIREGTMVSSELTSFREFSIKEAWGGLKKKLQKLWEKIKGVFRTVYAKLTVWLVRNGKAFVALHRKTLANKTGLGNCKIPKYKKRKAGFKPEEIPGKLTGQATNFANLDFKNSYAVGTKSVDEELKWMLGNTGVGKDVTPDNYEEAFMKAAFEDVTDAKFSELGVKVEELFNNITTKSKSIKDLKTAERNADKAIKSAISSLDKAAKEEQNKEQQDMYKSASMKCSAFERAITITTRCAIKAIRTGVAQDRQVIGKLVAYSPKAENAVLEEMAWLEGADDFAEVDDIPAEEINADDVQSDPDVEINVTVDDDGNECSK